MDILKALRTPKITPHQIGEIEVLMELLPPQAQADLQEDLDDCKPMTEMSYEDARCLVIALQITVKASQAYPELDGQLLYELVEADCNAAGSAMN